MMWRRSLSARAAAGGPGRASFSRLWPPFQARVVKPRISTLTLQRSSVRARTSAQIAAMEMGRPRIEPELSSRSVTHGVAELGVLLDLEGQGRGRVCHDAGEAAGIEDAFLAVEFPDCGSAGPAGGAAACWRGATPRPSRVQAAGRDRRGAVPVRPGSARSSAWISSSKSVGIDRVVRIGVGIGRRGRRVRAGLRPRAVSASSPSSMSDWSSMLTWACRSSCCSSWLCSGWPRRPRAVVLVRAWLSAAFCPARRRRRRRPRRAGRDRRPAGRHSPGRVITWRDKAGKGRLVGQNVVHMGRARRPPAPR